MSWSIANWTTTTTTPLTAYDFSAYHGGVPAEVVETKKPPRPKFGDNIRAAFKHITGGEAKPTKAPPRKRTPGGMEILPIGGAAPEAEVKSTVEHKKKITLERTVGVRRDKGSGPEETHSGKVILVRTMEGPDHLTANVGIKTEPNGSGHVEIPLDDLYKALDDLR